MITQLTVEIGVLGGTIVGLFVGYILGSLGK